MIQAILSRLSIKPNDCIIIAVYLKLKQLGKQNVKKIRCDFNFNNDFVNN